MARRRFYRRYIRTVPKKKWATNFKSGNLQITSSTSGSSSGTVTLVENSTQTATPTPIIIKTGNFKVQGDCTIGNSGSSSPTPVGTRIVVYVLFMPEGLLSTSVSSIIDAHPEWILSWKVINTTSLGSAITNSDTFSVSSRLKRNLNSGDRIVLAVIATSPYANMPEINLAYTAQYWTCAN